MTPTEARSFVLARYPRATIVSVAELDVPGVFEVTYRQPGEAHDSVMVVGSVAEDVRAVAEAMSAPAGGERMVWPWSALADGGL